MRRLAALLPLLLAACVTVTPAAEIPARPFDARPLIPEDWYRSLHENMEKCSGAKRPYEEIRWFVVENDVDMDGADGLWSWERNIYIKKKWVMNGPLIAHEILHYLTFLRHLIDGTPGPFEAKLLECGLTP